MYVFGDFADKAREKKMQKKKKRNPCDRENDQKCARGVQRNFAF